MKKKFRKRGWGLVCGIWHRAPLCEGDHLSARNAFCDTTEAFALICTKGLYTGALSLGKQDLFSAIGTHL